MVFIFANIHKHSNTVEHNVGPCQFCHNPGNSVDIVEQHSQTNLFGLFPTKEQVNRLAICRKCGKSIKEVYYTMRNQPTKQGVADLPLATEIRKADS